MPGPIRKAGLTPCLPGKTRDYFQIMNALLRRVDHIFDRSRDIGSLAGGFTHEGRDGAVWETVRAGIDGVKHVGPPPVAVARSGVPPVRFGHRLGEHVRSTGKGSEMYR